MVRCELCEVIFGVATVSRENGPTRGLYKRQIIGEPCIKAERKLDCRRRSIVIHPKHAYTQPVDARLASSRYTAVYVGHRTCRRPMAPLGSNDTSCASWMNQDVKFKNARPSTRRDL